MSRPCPTDWLTATITPRRAEELRRKAVADLIASQVRALKELFYQRLCLSTTPEVFLPTGLVGPVASHLEAWNRFAAELRQGGFEVTVNDNRYSNEYGTIVIRWSV